MPDTATEFKKGRPLNVHVARGSAAERMYRDRGGLPAAPEAIAPGLPPTPRHDLVFHGGKTIPNLTFTNFYIGGPGSWGHTDIAAIDQALAAAMADRNLNNVMAQYFPGKTITSTSKPSQILDGPRPATFSKNDVEGLVQRLHGAGKLVGFDLGSTVFNFMLPSGTILQDEDTPGQISGSAHARQEAHEARPIAGIPGDEQADSLHGLGGYHGSVHVRQAGGADGIIYYAVGVFSERLPDGRTNGIPVFDKSWKNVLATFYHELNEARTDPDVEDAIRAGNHPAALKFLGWVSRQGEECGDFPVFEANPLTEVFQEVPLTGGGAMVPVQFQYSNAVHGPEGPIAAPHAARHHGRSPA